VAEAEPGGGNLGQALHVADHGQALHQGTQAGLPADMADEGLPDLLVDGLAGFGQHAKSRREMEYLPCVVAVRWRVRPGQDLEEINLWPGGGGLVLFHGGAAASLLPARCR